MPDLQSQFQQAQQDVNSLSRRPDNDTLLELYALYKQATAGDAGDETPSAFDFVRRAKYEAWRKLKGVPAEDAMRSYVEVAAKLKSALG